VNGVLSGIVFDFDGVIVDSHPVHMRAWKKFFESTGTFVSEPQLRFVMEGRKRDEILRHFLGELSDAKLLEYGYRKDHIFLDEAADVRPIDGLLTFLEDLEHTQLVLSIASSGSRNRLEFLLRQLGLDRFFRLIVAGDDVEHGKPDPTIFLTVARNLRIDPAELVAFEDAVSGVQAAKAAGLKCVGIAQAERASILLDAGADRIAPDFCSLSYAKLLEIFVADVPSCPSAD
jgi:beta-phosphoglucomutase